MPRKDQPTDCPACGGTGRVFKDGPIAFGDRIRRNCPTCKGKGTVPPRNPKRKP